MTHLRKEKRRCQGSRRGQNSSASLSSSTHITMFRAVSSQAGPSRCAGQVYFRTVIRYYATETRNSPRPPTTPRPIAGRAWPPPPPSARTVSHPVPGETSRPRLALKDTKSEWNWIPLIPGTRSGDPKGDRPGDKSSRQPEYDPEEIEYEKVVYTVPNMGTSPNLPIYSTIFVLFALGATIHNVRTPEEPAPEA